MTCMSESFYVNIPFNLIQSIRLVHALMESDYKVHIPDDHVDKFSRLVDIFNISFEVGVNGTPEIPEIVVHHSEPKTCIGSICRPLIFPHAMISFCRKQWTAERSINFSFAGKITNNRKAVLTDWFSRANPQAILPLSKDYLMDSPEVTTNGKDRMIFWSSQRGRVFPNKSWDSDYYSLLADSKFALCPDGDFVWTYRFFEATLCGAIPVIENYCPLYEGYNYRTMKDSISSLGWSEKEAQHNFLISKDRLTIPKEELNIEIHNLLSKSVIM